MARNFAQFQSRTWTDDHFKSNLTADSQWLYFALLSQPNLNGAGVLPLQDRRWKKLAKDMTADRIEGALDELCAHWYVLVDEETEEVLIRTFIRNDGLWKQPNVLKSALGHAKNTMSATLRAVIWHELQRLPLDELPDDRAKRTGTLIETLRGTLPGTLPEGFMEPPAKPSLPPFGVPEQGNHAPVIPITRSAQENPQVNDSQPTLPASLWEGFGEGFPQGFPEGSGVGAGVGEGAGVSLGKEEIPKPAASARTSPDNAGTLVAWWIDQCSERPPKRVIGQMSKEIKSLLDEPIHPDHIRNGITAWMAKECGPSALASFVNQAMNTRPQAVHPSKSLSGARGQIATAEQIASGEVEFRL
ncbi:hypothetical protein [Nocardiopsis sp. NRRL B-16309]|uniref:hypothetical protein n=1 Tax=Nocardiopsis sp. NRRL B-16309 TaxID=1519494 RepID=UPI0006B01B70|nr:hypothetical protein [Nocardiopsis sp. NRRL B-16309]